MPNLKDIKKRINSVRNTQQITRAMKMVAAARFRKAHQAVVEARPYSDKMHSVISSLAMREERLAHPLLAERGKDCALVVLLTSDRGLCGGFNVNAAKAVERFIREKQGGFNRYEVLVIGRKGREFLKSRPLIDMVKTHEGVTSQASYPVASLLGQGVVDDWNEGRYDAVFLVYNTFHSAISQEVTVDQLLPVVPRPLQEGEMATSFLYEPSRAEVLSSLLPKYVEVQLYRAFVESLASEHGARMSAMDNATSNAGDMISALTLQYNRARQAVITKELVEIISGAESVR